VSLGSTGVLAIPLQQSLAWLMLAIALVLARPRPSAAWLLAVPVVGALAWLVSRPEAGTLGMPLLIAAVLAMSAADKAGVDRRLLLVGGAAIVATVLFRFLQQAVPLVWIASDVAGRSCGMLTRAATETALETGSTFAGLDYLVTMTVFLGGWLASVRRPWSLSSAFAAGAIVVGHAVYLLALAATPDLLRIVPPVETPPFGDPYVPPPFEWSVIYRQAIPWNLPLVAAVIHGATALCMMRWARWKPEVARSIEGGLLRSLLSRQRGPAVLVAASLAVLAPVIGSLRLAPCSLEGKTLVANQSGQLDWERPGHDSYGQDSAGMFGMLPTFAESLGADWRWSADFGATDLDQADVVLLMHPDRSLAASQQDRIGRYVRDGGSLLVVSRGFVPQTVTDGFPAEFLRQASISISQDAAVSITGRWLASCQKSEHLSTRRMDCRNGSVFSDSGASLRLANWRVAPLVVGRWGWSAPEPAAAQDGGHRFERGEKLGDLVLAAEQRIGRGRVIVLGNDSAFTNEGLVSGYEFAGGLLSHLANRSPGAGITWRHAACFLCCLGILAAIVFSGDATRLVTVCVLFAATLTLCHAASKKAARVVPDGQRMATLGDEGQTNRLAYVGASHLEAFSRDAWGFDSVTGLALNLMRNGYLPLALPEITSDRLDKAALLLLIAPSRGYSGAERERIRKFVAEGGILICTVGAEQAAASAPLLADFGLRVPASPVPTTGNWHEPEPMGKGWAAYLNVEDEQGESYQAGFRFHAGWPVEAAGEDAEVIASARNQLPVVTSQTELPIAVRRRVGQGVVVLIGDTEFAMNKNLEYVGGQPFEGKYENAQFWRWLIADLTGSAEWVPPPPPSETPES